MFVREEAKIKEKNREEMKEETRRSTIAAPELQRVPRVTGCWGKREKREKVIEISKF